MLAPIFLLGAWIATSSERSSYIGTQMVVTFALATLENFFGPVYDLVEIRDRALGIIIGTVVSAVIYTFVWPESEARTLPQKLAGTLGMFLARCTTWWKFAIALWVSSLVPWCRR